MKRIMIKKNNLGLVGIVTAILLIGLIVIVISIVQIVYVPILMKQRESEHMDRVAEQFGFLTSIINNQAADERKSIPIVSFVTLGSKELPLLVSSKAYGTLEVLENSCALTIQNESEKHTFQIGTIAFSSTNAYYLDQSYIYEAGAMIVSQYQGNKMMSRPSFFVDYNKINNTVNISFYVVNISSIGQKTKASGFGTYGVQTQFDEVSTNMIFNDVRSITINTNFSNAWLFIINSSLKVAGLNPEGPTPQFILIDMGEFIKLDFQSNLIVNMNFKIIEILVQIGPGWVQ